MSILIKGMEMPKSCFGCEFFRMVHIWNRDDEADIKSCCKRTGVSTFDEVNGYLSDCPLVPVPPHGRLIEADSLIGVLGILGVKGGNPVVWEQMRYIAEDMHTIIPAEESET